MRTVVNSLPVFETERLMMRGVTLADAPAYARHFVDYAVVSELAATVPWPYPEGGVADYITTQILPHQGKDKWVWGLFLKDKPDDLPEELIGTVDLWRACTPENRGFWLGRKFWGKGLMTEAVTPVMDYAFDHLGFEKLFFSNALGNERSRRVKEKTGARLLYNAPKAFVNPAYTQHEIWELTKEEWRTHRAQKA